MFDGGFWKLYFDNYKEQQREDILAMVDISLDTRDYGWFQELMMRLERVK